MKNSECMIIDQRIIEGVWDVLPEGAKSFVKSATIDGVFTIPKKIECENDQRLPEHYILHDLFLSNCPLQLQEEKFVLWRTALLLSTARIPVMLRLFTSQLEILCYWHIKKYSNSIIEVTAPSLYTFVLSSIMKLLTMRFNFFAHAPDKTHRSKRQKLRD